MIQWRAPNADLAQLATKVMENPVGDRTSAMRPLAHLVRSSRNHLVISFLLDISCPKVCR